MYYFVDVICSIAEIFFLTFLAESFFARRENRLLVPVLTYLCFGGVLFLLSWYPEFAFLRIVFWGAAGTLLIVVIFKARPVAAVFVSLSYIVICALTDIAVMVLLSLFGLTNQVLMEEGSARILYIIVAHIIELFLVTLVRFVKGYSSGKLKTRVLLPVCPTLAVSVLFCCVLASEISSARNINPLYLIVASGLLYTSITIILYTSWLQEQQEARYSLEIANHHYAMQKEYYEQLHSQQEQTRALWHDIKKYLRAVEAETASNASLHELQEMVDSIAPVVDVENRVVNIILNEYISLAADAETKLSLDIQVPPELPITAADLYILLGNTLDNALDACAALPQDERRIDLKLRMHNQMLFYRISNPYSKDYIHRRRNQFHGYGLKNVRECLDRNNGSMEVSDDNGRFVVSALINCV